MTSPLPTEQSDLLRLLGYLYLRHGQADKAVVIFDVLLALQPADGHAARSLACAQVRRCRPDLALWHLDRLRDAGDLSAVVWLLRGQALAQAGRMEEAGRAMQLFAAVRRAAP